MWGVQANRWLSLRLELMGESVVFLTAVMASVLLQANAGLAGLAITSSLNMCGFLNWMVRSVSEMEVCSSQQLPRPCPVVPRLQALRWNLTVRTRESAVVADVYKDCIGSCSIVAS